MWGMELVEGKDALLAGEHPKPKHNNHGNTVGLLLRILEPIFARGSVVVLDNGFCVLKGIIELKKRGVYMSALIKSVTTGQSTSRVMTSSHTLMTRMFGISMLGKDRWMRWTFMSMPRKSLIMLYQSCRHMEPIIGWGKRCSVNWLVGNEKISIPK